MSVISFLTFSSAPPRFRYLCLASLHCPGPPHRLACPFRCHQRPEHPGARCCRRPTVTPHSNPLSPSPSSAALSSFAPSSATSYLGKELDRCLSAALTTSNVKTVTAPCRSPTDRRTTSKNDFPVSFYSSNECVNLTYEMNVLCN